MANHIHLYAIGDTPTVWHTLEYSPSTTAYLSARMALDGKIQVTVLTDANGDPVLTDDINLLIIVRDEDALGETLEQRMTELKSLLGRVVNYVPHDHVESPLSPIYQVLFEEMGDYPPFSKALDRYDVPVKLKKGTFA